MHPITKKEKHERDANALREGTMNTEECYRRIGGNFEDVLTRFGSEALVTRFALQFLEDPTYDALQKALKTGDDEAAFRAAHTIKGLCSNLGFTALWQASDCLCKRFRAGQAVCAADTDSIRSAYGTLVEALTQLRDSQ